MQYLIMYDVSDSKRLLKVAKIIKDYGERIQLSVFIAELSQSKFNELKQRIEKVISSEEDGVKYFLLCEKCLKKRITLGMYEENQNFSFTII